MMVQSVVLPATVKVGYRTYRIEIWDTLEAMGANRYGECSHTARCIRVDVRHGPVQAAETLLHEILHAVWTIQMLKDDDGEERAVSAVSNGLTAVWIDNPGLLEWFSSHVTAE